MTALSASAARGCRGTPFVVSVPVKASAVIYKGGLVMVGNDGYAIPGADTASCLCFGVAMEDKTGGASDADVDVKVGFGAEWKFAASSITQAMLQTTRAMYIVDDNTIDDAAGATNDVFVGVLTEYVSATEGWVFVTGPCTYPTTGITASAAEINKLTGVTGGTVTAALAVVVDANKDIGDFRNLDCVNLDAGASGTAGTVDIFPSTASKGKLSIGVTDQAGNTTVTLTIDEMAAARTIHVADPGATAYVMMTADSTAGNLAATNAEINRTCDVSTRLIAAGGTLSATVAAHDGKVICLDTAAGSVVTLPAAAGTGARFYFVVTTTATSNSHIVKVAGAADTMVGMVTVEDDDDNSVKVYIASGTDDTFTMNRTTTGGLLGDWFEAIDTAATVWSVRGGCRSVAGQNPADVFSATVA